MSIPLRTSTTPFLRGACPMTQSRARVKKCRLAAVTHALQVRPYTTRKGDTVEAIARKRGFSVDELHRLNHSTDMAALEEGTTILIPAEKLSERDREIISGIGQVYRTYPVREGETIEDIIHKRSIAMEELRKLNPNIDLDNITPNEILKLPVEKYTVREKEMLMGVVQVPSEFFQSKGFITSTSVIGVAILVSLFLWLKRPRNKNH